MATRGRKPYIFTQEDLDTLKDLRRKGKSVNYIADYLNAPQSAVLRKCKDFFPKSFNTLTRWKPFYSKKRVTKKLNYEYTHVIKYDFLTNNMFAMHWAKLNYPELFMKGKGYHEVDFILYLYGLGFFNAEDFDYIKGLLNMDYLFLKRLGYIRYQNKGIIKQIESTKVRPNVGTDKRKIYCLTDKYKKMCRTIHEISIGEIPISKELLGITDSKSKKNTTKRDLFLDFTRSLNEKRKEN